MITIIIIFVEKSERTFLLMVLLKALLFCQMFIVFLAVGKMFNFMEILKQIQYYNISIKYLKLRSKNTKNKKSEKY